MRKTVALALLVALATGMAASGAAQVTSNNTESTNITVSVMSTSAIDIKPDTLDYNNVRVGNTRTQSNNSIGFTGVQIENIGSEGIDKIWADATKPSVRPFATGNASKYDAGNFMMIKPPNPNPATPNVNTYHFINRREYNESNKLTYIETDPASLSATATKQYYGRFRAGDQWYFWSIPVNPSDTQPCDGNNDRSLYVGNTPHTPTSTGTVDFTASGTDWTNYSIQTVNGANVGVAQNVNLTVDGQTRTYDVLTNCNTGNVYTTRTRFNVRAEGANDLTTAGGTPITQFLFSAADNANNLKPGGSVAVPTAIQVPQGVAEGETSQGSLTFYVSTEK